MQLKYYLWYLKREKGLEMTGILVYPEERKRREVQLAEEDESELRVAVAEIREIIAQETPPEREKKPILQELLVLRPLLGLTCARTTTC